MPPLIDREKCTGCGTCAEICNSSLFVFDRGVDRFPRIKFPEECWHCDSCVLDCPVGLFPCASPCRTASCMSRVHPHHQGAKS